MVTVLGVGPIGARKMWTVLGFGPIGALKMVTVLGFRPISLAAAVQLQIFGTAKAACFFFLSLIHN